MTHIPNTHSFSVNKNSLFFPLGKTSLMMIDGNNSRGKYTHRKTLHLFVYVPYSIVHKAFYDDTKVCVTSPKPYTRTQIHLYHIAGSGLHKPSAHLCTQEWGAYINRNQSWQYLFISKIII